MQLSHDRASRAARLVFTTLMAVAWAGGAGGRPAPARAADPAPAPAADAGAAAAVGVLKRLGEVGRQELAKPGADPSDVPAKAAALGFDVDRIFAFVRDDVAYEPYRGVLRGARGALAAGAGNAADKSLLLKALLDASGHEARVVRGSLAPADATALVAQFLKADPQSRGPLADFAAGTPPGAPADAGYADLAKRVGLDPAAVDAWERDAAFEANALQAESAGVADREFTHLRARLDEAKVSVGSSADAWAARLAERAADHAWVEVKRAGEAGAADAWLALDPSFAGATAGQSRGKPDAAARPFAAADEHRLLFKLVYARGPVDKVEEVTLLDVSLPASELMFDWPGFSINPADELPPLSKLSQMSEAELTKTLAGVTKYQAILRTGKQQFAARPFDLTGGVYDVSAGGRVSDADKLGGAVGGMFGGALGGGGDDAPAGEFRELAVVIGTGVPGEERPRTQRRVLLTAADVAGKHVLSPILSWEILVQPQFLSGAFVGHAGARHMLSTLDPLVAALEANGNADAGTGAAAGKAMDKLVAGAPAPFPSLLVNLALMRQSAIATALAARPGIVPLVDAPQVAIAERRFCMNADAGHACGRARVDIVDNAIAFVPRDAASAPVAAELAMRQGMFDTAAEALLLQRATGGADVRSPIDDFVRARIAKAPLTVLPATDVKTAATALSAGDRAWVAANEPAGRVIVAPASVDPATADGDVGWYTIDPQTGTVLGRRSGGRGEAMTERAVMDNLIAFHVCMMSPIWDAASGNVKDTKSGLKASLAVAACFVGMGVGYAPAVMKGEKAISSLTRIWIITGAVVVAGDKILS